MSQRRHQLRNNLCFFQEKQCFLVYVQELQGLQNKEYLIEFYQLVTDLRKINLILVDIEKVIDDINRGGTTATLTPELKGKIILENTEEKLREVMGLLVRFKERELHPYLSPSQISYYQDYLISKYNGILDIIENKSNN